MHLPLRWWRWREERALQLRLAQAEQQAAMADLARQVSVAELQALQAQVEPHFLFNALASLQQLIRHEPAMAERFLGELHSYLRLALPCCASCSTVEREFALAHAYLTVMATRLGARLRFEVETKPACAAHPMPPLMLLDLGRERRAPWHRARARWRQHLLERAARGQAVAHRRGRHRRWPPSPLPPHLDKAPGQ